MNAVKVDCYALELIAMLWREGLVVLFEHSFGYFFINFSLVSTLIGLPGEKRKTFYIFVFTVENKHYKMDLATQQALCNDLKT